MYVGILSAMSFYAVKVGKSPGVYRTWEDCAKQVHKYPKAVYKKFSTMSDANRFIKNPTYSYKPSKRIRTPMAIASCSSIHSSSNEHLPSASMVRPECSGASAHPEPIPKVPKRRVMIPDPPPIAGCTAFVYTDGSCLSNGIKGVARGGIGVYWGEESEYNISRKIENGKQTNGRAELLAILAALEQGIHRGVRRLEVRSDSDYALKFCDQRLDKWYRNDWKLSNKQNACHKDVLLKIHSLVPKYESLHWTHIPGHKGYFGNEMADKLARTGAST